MYSQGRTYDDYKKQGAPSRYAALILPRSGPVLNTDKNPNSDKLKGDLFNKCSSLLLGVISG